MWLGSNSVLIKRPHEKASQGEAWLDELLLFRLAQERKRGIEMHTKMFLCCAC